MNYKVSQKFFEYPDNMAPDVRSTAAHAECLPTLQIL